VSRETLLQPTLFTYRFTAIVKAYFKAKFKPYAAFTHAGLTTRYRTKNLYKSIFVLPA